MTLTWIARRLYMGAAGSLGNLLRDGSNQSKYAIVGDPFRNCRKMRLESNLRITPPLIRTGVGVCWRRSFLKKRELSLTALFLVVLLVATVRQGWGVLVAPLWILVWWGRRIKLYFRWLHDRMSRYHNLEDGKMTIVLDDDAVTVMGGKSEARYAWGQLYGIREHGDVLLLSLKGAEFTILPLDQLSSEVLSVLRERAPRRLVI